MKEFMGLTIELRARSEKFQELRQVVLALLPPIRKEDDCIESRIFNDMENDEIFLLWIQWRDAAALKRYLRSGSGSAILGAIDLLGEKVRVKIGAENCWEGIETLKKIRNKTVC
jgi:quinol monooxygenase YgiN